MALLHQATLTPTKLELLDAWLPTRTWAGTASGYRQLGAYRFDDPAGEVGIEAFLVAAGDGPVLHVPVTYRAAPLAGAEEALVGTTEHSVLGPRWVYDACADPVWANALATAVLTGATQVEQWVEGQSEPRRPTATVVGSGGGEAPVDVIGSVRTHDEATSSVIRGGGYELRVVRLVGSDLPGAGVLGVETLTGRWDGGGPAVLAGCTVAV